MGRPKSVRRTQNSEEKTSAVQVEQIEEGKNPEVEVVAQEPPHEEVQVDLTHPSTASAESIVGDDEYEDDNAIEFIGGDGPAEADVEATPEHLKTTIEADMTEKQPVVVVESSQKESTNVRVKITESGRGQVGTTRFSYTRGEIIRTRFDIAVIIQKAGHGMIISQ